MTDSRKPPSDELSWELLGELLDIASMTLNREGCDLIESTISDLCNERDRQAAEIESLRTQLAAVQCDRAVLAECLSAYSSKSLPATEREE